ncbi:MAG TPA: hypothetical protein ENN58_00265 [bacterium]|nr:hypothetical protein [bacterium]
MSTACVSFLFHRKPHRFFLLFYSFIFIGFSFCLFCLFCLFCFFFFFFFFFFIVVYSTEVKE